MGIHVCLPVLLDRIDDDAWDRFYADSTRLLSAWKVPPLGSAWRTIAGERVAAYSRSCEHEHGWHVVGDARSLRTAESFQLPKRLPATRRGAHVPDDDVLIHYARGTAGGRDDSTELLGQKTQGEPYHTLMVAVATLAENRLPRTAIACGDIDHADADEACSELQRIFAQPFGPPVVTSEPRIRERLAGRVPDEVVNELVQHYRPDPSSGVLADILGLLDRAPGARLLKQLERDALVCSDARQLAPEVRHVVEELAKRLGLRARQWPARERDRASLLGAVASGTARSRIRLTDDAWDEIEAADDRELEFLVVLASLECGEIHRHALVRAMFQNRALRSYALLHSRAA